LIGFKRTGNITLSFTLCKSSPAYRPPAGRRGRQVLKWGIKPGSPPPLSSPVEGEEINWDSPVDGEEIEGNRIINPFRDPINRSMIQFFPVLVFFTLTPTLDTREREN